MDLVKLLADLREYRAQIEEAIGAFEELARQRYPGSARRKDPDPKSLATRPRTKSRKRRARRNKSS